MFAPTSTLDVYSDYNDQALDAGQGMSDAIHGMLEDYGMLQDVDADWALDWDLPDDWLGMSASGGNMVGRYSSEVQESGLVLAGGDNWFTRRGKRIHREISTAFRGFGWYADQNIPGCKLRPDAFNPVLGIVVEFKPANVRAMVLGERKMKHLYLPALQRAFPNVNWQTMIISIP